MKVFVPIVLWWCLAACAPEGVDPDPSPSPTVPAPSEPPTVPTPEPPAARPQNFIQWSCHQSKPTCTDRTDWAKGVDLAYTVWRGDRDLQYLLDPGRAYLRGGVMELVALSPGELRSVITTMREVAAKGDRLIFRILTEKHRDFDANQLGAWHRCQVRKSVAVDMRGELEAQSRIYGDIAAAFPFYRGCDSIRCWLQNATEVAQ